MAKEKKLYEIQFSGGEARMYPGEGCNYMMANIEGGELYAEHIPAGDDIWYVCGIEKYVVYKDGEGVWRRKDNNEMIGDDEMYDDLSEEEIFDRLGIEECVCEEAGYDTLREEIIKQAKNLLDELHLEGNNTEDFAIQFCYDIDGRPDIVIIGL